MLEAITIENYRSLTALSVKPLEQLNLFAGPNGIGKTAFLEAVWLHSGRRNPSLAWNTHILRGWRIPDLNPLQALAATKGPVKIVATDGARSSEVEIEARERHSFSVEEKPAQAEGGTPGALITSGPITSGTATFQGPVESRTFEREIVVRRRENGQVTEIVGKVRHSPLGTDVTFEPLISVPRSPSNIFLAPGRRLVTPEMVDRFSHIVREGTEGEVLEGLKIIEPRVKRVEVLTQAGTADLWGTLNDGLRLPILQLGDGLFRFLDLLLSLVVARGGIVAIDEIETGVHHTLLTKIWQQIGLFASRFEVQVFATTHSKECIASAYEASLAPGFPNLVLHRLYRDLATVAAEPYRGGKLKAAVEAGFEVR